MALTKVVGELIDIGDLDISNVGSIQLDSIAGDADSNTSITFSGSDVITVATGGTTALTVDASQVLNLTSHLDMPDSANVKLGTGDDLLLYHDGTNSKIETASGSSGDLYIAAQGTNHDLYLRADDDIKIQPQGGEDGITLVGNGAVTLYYDNSAKLATASDGVDITGDVGATTATIAGNITQSDGDYLYTGGGNFDIKHNTASQNIVFSTTPSGGSATEVLRITHDGKLSRLSGDLTLDVAGRIDLSADDNGEIRLYDGSSMYGQFKDDSDRFTIQGLIADADMLFVINDGGTATTALKLDAADGGDALFYGDLQAPGIYVGSTNTSYDFYNNGTSYLNGAVTVDDALTVANAITVTNGNSTFTTASSWGAGLTIKQTNDDASPAYLSLHKDPASGHSTLADNDYIGFINMKAKDDAGNAHTYVELAGVATDVSSGAETSKFTINTWGAGTEYPTNLVATGGKVGIGTTSPTYPLDVVSNSSAQAIKVRGRSDHIGEINITNNAGDSTYSQIQSHSTELKIKTLTDIPMSFYQNSSEAMRIDSAGRLLVGLPSSDGVLAGKLQVESTGADATFSIHRASADAGGPYIILSSSRAGSIGDDTVVQNGDVLGYLLFAAADGTDRASTAAYISGEIDGTPGSNDTPGKLLFCTTADGAASATERMRITSTGAVGIGTGGPDGILHLDEGAADDCRLICETHAAGDSMILFTQGNSGPAWGVGLDASATDGLSFAYSASGYPSLTTGNKATIDTSGHFKNIGKIGVLGASTTEMSMASGSNGDQTVVWRWGANSGNTVGYFIDDDNAGVYMNSGSTSWSAHSDERVKENITSLGTVMPDLKNIRCVKYNRIGNSETKIGFIAQDWETSSFSEVVDEDDGFVIEDDGTVEAAYKSESTTILKGISYTETIPVLLKAIQELEARIATLEG